MSILNNTLLRSISILALASAATAAVHAQDGSSDADESRRLNKITITGLKQGEQSLQDVPVVVTALSAETIADAGVRDIKDLTILTPGLLVTSSTNQANTTARIRGVGTVGDNPGLESSVAIAIDGVGRARNGVAFGDLGEIERIEVLKGPQGTLFGKSSSAGVINIVTKGPEDSFGAQADLTIGNLGLVRTSGSVTGPLSESVRGRLFAVQASRDGIFDVVTGGGPRTENQSDNYEFYSLRGQLEFDLGDEGSLRVIGDYTDREENCCLAEYIARDAARGGVVDNLAGGQGGASDSNIDDRIAYANRDAFNTFSDFGLSAELKLPVGFGDLNSVTSYREFETGRSEDTDWSTADIWYRGEDGQKDNFTNFSQEFRLSGDTDRLDWLVGLYYATEELERRSALTYGNDYFDYWNTLLGGGLAPFAGAFWQGGAVASDDSFKQNSTTLAVFTHNTFAVTDSVDATLGLRFTSDEKELRSSFDGNSASCSTVLPVSAAAAGVACLAWSNDFFHGITTDQSRTDEEVSGTFKLSYRPNDNLLTYASFARGYKAGGFNLDRGTAANDADRATSLPSTLLPNVLAPGTDTSFDPETVNAYEAGAKWNNDTSSLTVNGAVFFQDYADFQLNTFLGTVFVVESIPELTSTGIDLDFRWLPETAEFLTLQGGLTLADTKFGEFDAAGQGLSTRLSGGTIGFAPTVSASLAATIETPFIGEWDARWNLTSKYTSDYNTGSNLDPQKDVDAMFLVNGRLVVARDDSPFSVELWGQNLTDQTYPTVAFDTPLQGSDGSAITTFLAAPRTYGVTLKATF